MIWLAYLTLSVFIVYLVLCIILILHWNKTALYQYKVNKSPHTSISVIVPVRNEAENIRSCINSLLSQSYPSDRYEIIIVDDQSYDETPDILEEIKDPRVHYMRLGVEKRTTIEGSKKKALSYGVNHAKGSLIVTTDGDCILPENWLLNIAQFYEEFRPKLIVGPVNLHSKSGILNIFQSLDIMSSFLIHTAGISSGLSYLCSGANLAYEKESFLRINPYENNLHIASGDDIFLIQKFKKEFPDKIKVLKSQSAICLTNPQDNIKSFINQRMRWASKMKYTSDLKSLIMASLVWLQKILPFVLLVVSIIYMNKTWIICSSLILLSQFIIDFFMLYQVTSFFQCRNKLWYFLPVEILHSIYFLLLGFFSWLPLRIEWKDRYL